MKKLFFILGYAVLFYNGQTLLKDVVAPDKVDQNFLEQRLEELTSKALHHLSEYKVDS